MWLKTLRFRIPGCGIGAGTGDTRIRAPLSGWAVDFYGNHFLYREYERDRVPPSQTARNILGLTEDEYAIRDTMFGPDAWAKRSEGVGPYKRQMTMKSVADIFGEQGLVCQPANDDRLNGWQNLRDLMYWDANIQPKFFVLESCTNVLECLPAMIHDEHKVEDMKAHKRDHLPDAIRYVCMHTVDSVRPHQSVIDRAMLLGEFDDEEPGWRE